MRPLVTVDGPSGSGKSTLGRRLASALHVPLIDTGLFYRGVTVAAVRAGLDASDTEAVTALARTTRLELNTDPEASPDAWQLRVDGADAGELLRDPRHAPLLSAISAIPGVRDALLDAQRSLAVGGAVAVGRDCGTVVFPDAAVKIYLVAEAEVRAARRAAQLAESGARADSGDVAADVQGRDAVDSSRATAPLRPAADAHIIDTTTTSIDEMTAISLDLCRSAGWATTPA